MVGSHSVRLRFNQEFVFTGSWISVKFSRQTFGQDVIVFIEGPLGEAVVRIKMLVNAQIAETTDVFARPGVYFSSVNRTGAALIGTYASVMRQNINGLIKPFYAFVEVRGLGYRIRCLSENSVEFTVGFSHVCVYDLVGKITAKAVGVKARVIEFTSVSWLLLRQCVADVKRFRPAGVYNERGIYEKDEKSSCKDGKKKKFG